MNVCLKPPRVSQWTFHWETLEGPLETLGGFKRTGEVKKSFTCDACLSAHHNCKNVLSIDCVLKSCKISL